MANTIIGKVLVIGRTEEIPSKNGSQPFLKRTLVLDCSRYDQYTGQKFENYPQLEFASKNTAILDNFNVGDVVEVSFALQGRSYEKDGVQKYFTSIVGYKVKPYNTQQSQQNAPQAPQNAPQAEQSNRSFTTPAVDANGNPMETTEDGLPF